MITENVDDDVPLVIIKTFGIQPCVRGFHFFQGSWQPKLGEKLNVSNEDEPSSLVHDRRAIVCKDKNRKTVGYVPKYVSKQIHFFFKQGGGVKIKVNGKWRYSKVLSQGGQEIPCTISASSENKKNVTQI